MATKSKYHQARYAYAYCQECGRPLAKSRHGLEKFCSPECLKTFRYKYRSAWYKERQLLIKEARAAGIDTKRKYYQHKNALRRKLAAIQKENHATPTEHHHT